MKALHILFVESFYGGSHRSFADGMIAHTRHHIDLVTLPAERWRRRIKFGAFEIMQALGQVKPGTYDAILVTDLIDVADLRALWPEKSRGCPPIVLYMHESQLTYPPSRRRGRDAALELQDIKNCAIADRVAFNSHFHRDAFLAAVESVSGETDIVGVLGCSDRIKWNSDVLYPGVHTAPPIGTDARVPIPTAPVGASRRSPRILWNHRWEYDKRPNRFFRTVHRLAEEGEDFELVVLGESAHGPARPVREARDALGGRIVQWGYVEDRTEYARWLAASDIVVSTAVQENFGIAVVEAITAGCVPILPNRLSYPEIIPEAYHDSVLYDDNEDFADRLRSVLREFEHHRRRCEGLAAQVAERFGWNRRATQLDRFFSAVVDG